MAEEKVNLNEARNFEFKPGDQPWFYEAYINPLCYEIVVFRPKKDTPIFRCREYYRSDLLGYTLDELQSQDHWSFEHVIMDTSKHNDKGEITLHRYSYYPSIALNNCSWMAMMGA